MKSIWLLMVLVASFSAKAQTDSLQFPQDFYGIYKGDLQIVNARGRQTLQMEFHLNKTDSIGKYQYMLVYIMNGERQERKYHLVTKDASKGEYLVDENNGILINAKVMDNTIYSMYEVQDNILTTTERFYKDAMDFEITVSHKTQKLATGTIGENAIEVISYPVFSVQKAHLQKQ